MLARLLRMVRTGLEATASLWSPIQAAYGFVHRAAHLLANHEQWETLNLQQHYQRLLAELRAAQVRLGPLADAVAHFRTVTASYWRGLFACYDVPDLPRTNNDLEHSFGTARHLERRATGRKGASPALVVRGSVRVVAALATHLLPPTRSTRRPCNRVTSSRGSASGSRWSSGTRPAVHRRASAATQPSTWQP